jgi:hypothetical protein
MLWESENRLPILKMLLRKQNILKSGMSLKPNVCKGMFGINFRVIFKYVGNE